MFLKNFKSLRKEQVLGPDDSEVALLRHYPNNDKEATPPRVRLAYIFQWSYITHAILLLLCAFFLTSWIRSRRQCVDPPYSPANVAIEYQKELSVFNGSFNFPSIYRGDPTPELDEAWHRISKGVTSARLTREQLLKIGKEDTSSKVKFSEADGGGYMGSLEVAHELHCLNVLRKYLHFDYYGKFDPFFTESKSKTYRTHLEHCIEDLRQSLMCTANAGMITFEWVRGFSTPYPDFNTRHQCRDFEKLISWQNAHGVRGVPQSHIMRLDGEVDLKQVP